MLLVLKALIVFEIHLLGANTAVILVLEAADLKLLLLLVDLDVFELSLDVFQCLNEYLCFWAFITVVCRSLVDGANGVTEASDVLHLLLLILLLLLIVLLLLVESTFVPSGLRTCILLLSSYRRLSFNRSWRCHHCLISRLINEKVIRTFLQLRHSSSVHLALV